MTLKECYDLLGGDYDNVLGRLRTESLIQKFVLKFLDDGSFDLLCTSMKEKNREEAFRAAHTIKGVCQNLSFTRLEVSSSALCEALRNEWLPEAEELYSRTAEDYELTTAAIRSFREQLEQ